MPKARGVDGSAAGMSRIIVMNSRLEITYADFSSEDPALLQARFARCTAITHVKFFDCVFTSPKEFASSILARLQSSNRLVCLMPGWTIRKQLDLLHHSSPKDEGMAALAEGSKIRALRSLIIGKNNIDPMGGASLVRMVLTSPRWDWRAIPPAQMWARRRGYEEFRRVVVRARRREMRSGP